MRRTILRLVAGFAGLLALAVSTLWLLGGRTSMNEASLSIAASPEEVFSYLADPAKAKLWMEGVKEITPLGEGDHCVGARARIVVEENGNPFEMQDEIIRIEKNRLFELRITSSMFDLTNRYELSESGGATQLTQTMRANYLGYARVFAPLLGGEIQRKLAADLQRLKQLVEAR